MSSTDFKETLALDLESPINVKDGYSGNIYSGYFKAPATAGYRFYIAVDDEAYIYFSSVSNNPSSKTLLYQSGYTSYRNYITTDGRRTTRWLNLTKDEYYYLEVRHIQYFGGDHISVAVEIEDPAIVPGHHHTTREIQRLFVMQDLLRETTVFTIDLPDGGEFALGFVDPKTNTNYVGPKLNTNMTAWEFN
jgi:hypothetical protein